MSSNLREEFQYYLDNQDRLVEEYGGKVIVIKDSKVIGVFDSDLEAIEEVSKEHELGTFLVQKCEAGPDSYLLTYHSRVAFA